LATKFPEKQWKGVLTKCLAPFYLSFFILALLGALPTWGYSGGWGYYPSGGIGLILLVVVVLLLMGRF
jgi:hypothetical protein